MANGLAGSAKKSGVVVDVKEDLSATFGIVMVNLKALECV